MRRCLQTLILAVAVGLAAGCGASDTEGPEIGASKSALEDLGQMLKSLAAEGQKPPAKLAEFGRVEPMIPVASPAIRDGSVVYLWGSEYAAGSQKVAAHEKKTPAEGGLVLLQDGTVKEMSAEEFAAAPKAK